MAEIKRSTAKITKGILTPVSGSTRFLRVTKSGRLKLVDPNPKKKLP